MNAARTLHVGLGDAVALAVAVAVIAAVVALGCSQTAKPLATLETRNGTVDRDHASKVGLFIDAREGERFFVGDGIRTSSHSNAKLRLMQGSLVEVQEKTLLRFLTHTPDDMVQGLDLELGQAIIATDDRGLAIQTAFGDAVIQPHATLNLGRSVEGMRFEVTLGAAVLDARGGRTQLTRGEAVELVRDRGVLRSSAQSDAGALAEASPPVARVIDESTRADISGGGAKVRDRAGAEYRILPEGTHTISPGSTLELPEGTHATLRAGDGSMRLAGAGRFFVGGPGDPTLRVDTGSVEVAQTHGIVTIKVPGGKIHAQAGAKAALDTGKDGTRLRVAVGTVKVQGDKDNESVHGGAEVALRPDGRIRRSRTRSLDYADFYTEAGDSLVVHDPHPPTAVGFTVSGKCEGLALLEFGPRNKQAIAGENTLSVALEPGTHPYTVRCSSVAGRSEAVARGAIVVLGDAGTRRLPTVAPSTLVDADGRKYTVLYQNQLPEVTVRWPRPPSSGSFALEVAHSVGRSETISVPGPEYKFASGKLGEGSHRLTFQAGATRSKTTTLEIRFDNARPTASIASPADSTFQAGAQVVVGGTALPGMQVSAAGVALALDEQHRFSGEVTAPALERALAIRFTHPQRGTHVYLRRAAGSTAEGSTQ